MASSRGNVHSDTAKKEQIITEFFTKVLQIILESRSPYMSSRNYSGEQVVSSPSSSSSSSSSVRTRDKWFNLALRECPAALENIDFWRQSNLEPMVIDVILVKRVLDWDPVSYSPKSDVARNSSFKEQVHSFMNLEQDEFGVESRNEKVIERWVVQYESRKLRDSGPGGKKSSGNLHTLYKKSIVLLRSLYVTIKLLPAYKLYRDLISSGQIQSYTLTHRVSSFVEPFTRREEADMQRFNFTPVDTQCGRLCLSVMYRGSLSEVSSEPSTPMSPQVIPDYVGSPLADPLKRFPSLPVSHGSPCSPFARRHSWSYENYRACSPSTLPSPSPTYSDSHAAGLKCRSRIPPPLSLPQHLPETFQSTGKTIGYDEYWPSPNFSPSTSPSPPMYTARGDAAKVLFRCESAPVSIPVGKAFNKQTLPPSPNSKLSRAITLKSDKSTAASGSSTDKYSFGKDESGRFSGIRVSSNSSPRISFSRSSSRLSVPDDFDDTEFACPFVVDDDDMMDPSRPGSFDQRRHMNDGNDHVGSAPVKTSQDAAVGALVLMLKKAPPLRQDSLAASKATSSGSIEERGRQSTEQQSSILSSTYSTLKTTADALEELRSYKEMKELLLGQGNKSHMFNKSTSAEGVSKEKPK